MATLKEKLTEDFRHALKAGEKVKLSRLRLFLATLHNAEIEKRGPLADDDIVQLLRRELKRHQESIAAFEKGGRAERVAQEEAEMKILAAYVPKMLSAEAITALVKETVAGMGPDPSFGPVMGAVMKKVGSAADGATVALAVKKILSQKTS